MKKVIEIKKQGFVFHVDAEYVARHRAEYYAEDDDKAGYEAAVAKGIEEALDSEYDLVDWFQNNMDWADVPADKKKIVSVPKPVTSPEDLDNENGEPEVRVVHVTP